MVKKDLYSQKSFQTIVRIIICCYLFICTYTLSQSPTWLINNDIQAGVVTIVSNSVYLNGANSLYTQAYTNAFSTIPNVGVSTPTIDISPTPLYMQWKVNLPQSTNQTHFKLNMNYRTTTFNTFKVGFIAISGSITYLKVDYKQLTFATGISSGTGDRSAIGNFNLNIVINAANQLSLIPYLSGLKISSTQGDYKFQLKFTKNNNTNILYNATVSGTTTVTQIVAYILIYDITLGEQTQTIFLDYVPLVGVNNVLSAFSLVFFDKTNLLVGVGQFSFTSGFSFNLITDNLILTVPSSGTGAYFTSISFSFWSFRKRSCNAGTPYYEKTANLCYDNCPLGFLPVDPEKYCNPCSSYMTHCTRCDTSTKCTQCQSTWSVKGDQTGCQCSQGYYLNGLICQPCDTSCKTCSGNLPTNCLSCKNNTFYLDSSNRCQSCISPCKACSTSTVCLSCVDGYYFQNLNNTCLSCDFTCKTCSGSTSNDCLSCNGIDRKLNGTKCECKSMTQDGDGNCISLCDDVNCLVCIQDVGFCQQCKDASFVLSGGQCRCPTTHYYSTLNSTCYPCHQTCALCSGPTKNDCVSCFSSQYRQINVTNFNCQCKPTYYSPNSELTCIKQPSISTCPQYFVYNQTKNVCTEICGDGKLFQLPCDDGNLDTNDGCDQYCNVQSGFQCLYGDENSPSICSFSGQITFGLLNSVKETYKNELKLSYKLQPELKFYEKFFDFTNNFFVSDTTLKIVNASYNKDQKILHATISYNQSVTGKEIQLSYTPPSSPYFHSTLRTSFSWPVSVSNGLSLNYYPDQVYENSKIFQKLILGIYIGCLVVAFFSLFFRKMIGAQLIILAQTQILSITMLDEIHPYLSPLISDKWVFGYNDFQEIINMKHSSQLQFNKMYSILGFSPIFGQNINIMLFVVIFIYILSLILALGATFMQKSTSKKMKKAALILATEIAFGCLLFILMNVTTSYSIEVFEQTIWQFNPEYSGALKIVAIILIAANYTVYILFYKQSTQSYVFYNKRSCLSKIQPLMIATKTIIIPIGLALYHKLGVSMCYTLMSVQVVYVLFLCGIRPFKRVVDLIRAIVMELSLAYVIGSRYVLSQFVNLSNPGDWNTFLQIGVPAQYGLIGFSLLISLISLIIHLIKVNKHQAQIHPQQVYSEIDLFEKKQQSPQKYNNQQQYPSIQSYIEDFLEKNKQSTNDYMSQNQKPLKYKKQKKPKGLFNSQDLKLNSSLGQLIDISEIQIDDGLGNDSRRKMKNNTKKQRKIQNKNLDIIQMDDD